MPLELFCAPTSASIAARVRLVPVSIVVHAMILAGVVLGPLLADTDLPKPYSPMAYLIADVVLPAPPRMTPVPRRITPQAVRSTHLAAPVVTPTTLPTVDSITENVTPGGITGEPTASPDSDLIGLLPEGGGIAIPPPPQPVPPRIVKIGGGIDPPVKIRGVSPVYPKIALTAGIQGTVVLEAILDERGHVRSTRVLESVPLLDAAAIQAVRQWVYTPTRLNGVPVSVAMTVTLEFRLQR
jgi:protein TonB